MNTLGEKIIIAGVIFISYYLYYSGNWSFWLSDSQFLALRESHTPMVEHCLLYSSPRWSETPFSHSLASNMLM